MGLWSGGCDEEEKEFYYQKMNSETNYHKKEHETSFTNESLQVGNIAYKNIGEKMDKLKIKITDDGKGKSQSVSARVVVDDDDYYFTGIEGFGETEEEATEDLKNKIVPLCKQVVNLFKKEIEHACDTCGNGHCMDRDIFKPIPKKFCPGYCEKHPR